VGVPGHLLPDATSVPPSAAIMNALTTRVRMTHATVDTTTIETVVVAVALAMTIAAEVETMTEVTGIGMTVAMVGAGTTTEAMVVEETMIGGTTTEDIEQCEVTHN